jgi:hypothetical protein
LGKLLESPSDIRRFRALWPYLCSEGTAWAAAYAAVPYAVELARRLPPELRFEYLFFVGLVVTCSCPEQGESFELKPYLEDTCDRALDEALPLLAETLLCAHSGMETRYLLASAAALKGHPELADVLGSIECISAQCPRCGTIVFPDRLERVRIAERMWDRDEQGTPADRPRD